MRRTLTRSWVWGYNGRVIVSHGRPKRAPERLINKCKRCEYVGRGNVIKWPNKRWYWYCPHCLNIQGYPR